MRPYLPAAGSDAAVGASCDYYAQRDIFRAEKRAFPHAADRVVGDGRHARARPCALVACECVQLLGPCDRQVASCCDALICNIPLLQLAYYVAVHTTRQDRCLF